MTQPPIELSRRRAVAITAASMAVLPAVGCAEATDNSDSVTDKTDQTDTPKTKKTSKIDDSGETMQVAYLEIVTEDAEAACKLYESVHSISFGEPDPSVGGARTAEMKDGSTLAVRAPMHGGEKPVTRAYMLVEDIEAAVAAAKEAGAMIAVPPMEIPGRGTCAIYMHGGIESGLWQR